MLTWEAAFGIVLVPDENWRPEVKVSQVRVVARLPCARRESGHCLENKQKHLKMGRFTFYSSHALAVLNNVGDEIILQRHPSVGPSAKI